MRIPLSWLNQYIELSLPSIEIAKKLTMAGLEVDAIEKVFPSFQNVVVGRVLEVSKHPHADKLCIASVTDGKETFQVVCGAPNCRAGLKTAFARLGASFQEDDGKKFTIKSTKIRGIESFGMLCSPKELKLSDDAEGIIELPQEFQEGDDLAEFYADTIFEISLTPNLGHCASVLGVARELSALLGIPLKLPNIHIEEAHSSSIQNRVKVDVQEKEKCLRYACRLIEGITIKPSPEWLKNRLEACGIRSINNVVDATNYVLMEMGHPLHAFDFDKLAGHHLFIRCPSAHEVSFATLDEKERLLNEETLLICDEQHPVALAGIMGGRNSEVSDLTRNVLIESAYFLPTNIRRTSKRLGLQTEASKRFEKGCDPNNVVIALNRVTQLIQELAEGDIISGVIDVKANAFGEKTVTCRLTRINQVLGTLLSLSEVDTILQRLTFKYTFDGQDTYTIQIPTFRPDIHGEIDIIEEVARIYGYDNIPKHLSRYPSSPIQDAPIYLFEKEVRGRLMAEGLQEFLTCDLIGPSLVEIVQDRSIVQESIVRVMNPTSIEQSILRPSLLPGLLQSIKYNVDHGNVNISAFEIGRIHFKEGDQYKEQSVAGIVLSGKSTPHHWQNKPHDVDFFDLKGMIENILTELRIDGYSFKKSELNTLHTGRQATIFINSLAVGSLGEIHPSILRRLDVSQRIYYAELDLHDLFPLRKIDIKMIDIPIFPGTERDWTITLREETPIYDVIQTIREAPSHLLQHVLLLDLYRSERLGKERKNATFRFIYRDQTKTVAQEVVDAEHACITQEALKKLGKAVI